MEGPLVSIVVPVYNQAEFLPEAVASILSQSYEPWELLLVDDGSQDASPQVARELQRQRPDRIRCLEHPGHENRGISATRNRGVQECRGDLVAFLDADDVWLPGKLEQQVQILREHPQVGLVRGRKQYWGSWSGQLDQMPLLRLPVNRPLPAPSCLWLCSPLGPGDAPCPSDWLVRKSSLLEVGGFEERFPQLYEDHAFLCKLYLRSQVFVSDQLWSRYRQHPRSCCVRLAGQLDKTRALFLAWLQGYLISRKVLNPRIWWALGKARLKLGVDRALRPQAPDPQASEPAAHR